MSNQLKSVTVGTRVIGSEHAPFIVAELSANHGGSFERAIRIIDEAANTGADAVKFQAYTADSLTLNVDKPEFLLKGKSPWSGHRLHDLYSKTATPYEWFPALFERCRQQSIIPFASPFDKDAVDMLEALQCPAYKIASFEAIDHELIAACARTGKPVIISVGLCTQGEIGEAVSAARAAGALEIVLLQCNSAYPSPSDDANLLTIPSIMEEYGVLAGYSDHTLSATSSAIACALGACLIEKHFIDDRTQKTADSDFSITPTELEALIMDCQEAYRMRGSVRIGPTASESASLAFRRSLYVVRDISAGEKFTRSNIRSIRPSYGLAPKHLPQVLNSYATRSLQKGEALKWDMVGAKNND